MLGWQTLCLSIKGKRSSLLYTRTELTGCMRAQGGHQWAASGHVLLAGVTDASQRREVQPQHGYLRPGKVPAHACTSLPRSTRPMSFPQAQHLCQYAANTATDCISLCMPDPRETTSSFHAILLQRTRDLSLISTQHEPNPRDGCISERQQLCCSCNLDIVISPGVTQEN